MEKSNNTCQWIGEGNTACSCHEPAVEQRSYCEQHIWQVYQKGTRLGRRVRDQKRAAAVWDVVSDINQILEELEDSDHVVHTSD